jgi:hypothetical protein
MSEVNIAKLGEKRQARRGEGGEVASWVRGRCSKLEEHLAKLGEGKWS